MQLKSLLFVPFLCLYFFGFTQKSNPEKLGLLIIDAQKWYIPGHPESMYVKWDIKGHDRTHQSIIASMDSVLLWANQKNLPVVVTYEADNKGAYNLPDELLEDLNKNRTTHYTKFFYDATKHNDFEEIILKSGVEHWIIMGAETDVCVYQTVKGLLRLGKKVTLVTEAIYSGRNNTIVSRSNLQNFGANFISLKQLYNNNINAKPTVAKVEKTFTIDDLTLVIFPFSDTKNLNIGALKRLDYLKEYAKIINLKVEHPDSVNSPKTIILVAGNVTKENLEKLKKKYQKEIIILADCTPHLSYPEIPQNYRKHTVKTVFYELMETVSFYFKSPNELQGWQQNLKQAIDNGKLDYVESLQND